MAVKILHDWQVDAARAREIQAELAEKVLKTGKIDEPGLVAGVDISVDRITGTGTAAVVVLEYPGLNVVETSMLSGGLGFPYVPGLLSFREAPLILAAWEKLTVSPDMLMVDGQGIAHPRRLGLASHLGLFLDTPAIGCAKSRLCGCHEEPGDEAGSRAGLTDGEELIGAVLRTKTGVKPLYISIGHKLDLDSAVHWVLACCRGYRLPEPTRLAHLAAGGNLKIEEEIKSLAQNSEARCRN